MLDNIKLIVIPFLGALILSACAHPDQTSQSSRATAQNSETQDRHLQSGDRLVYDSPASEWLGALPVGNGRIGAMVYGREKTERIQLNEETFWSGRARDLNNDEALAALPDYRRLMDAGAFDDAYALAEQKMMGTPKELQAYQPLGDLTLHHVFHSHDYPTRHYNRSLDLRAAIAHVSYDKGPAHFTRETFASAPDNVIVTHLATDQPDFLAFSAVLGSKHEFEVATEDGDTLILRGQWNGDKIVPQHETVLGKNASLVAKMSGPGLKFEIRMTVISDGDVSAGPDGLHIDRANYATLLIAMETNFDGVNPSEKTRATIAQASARTYDTLKARHIADYQPFYDRVALRLADKDHTALPTNKRLARVVDGDRHAGLDATIFNYGRYLMISSSRPGTLPPNLQGLWNDDLWPAWGSKFTTNINFEMNFWPAETTNLSEMHRPMFDFLESLVEPGTETARIHYDADGFVVHHNTDIWRSTTPVDGPRWGLWPMGAAWMSTHMWEHYQFTQDKAFLDRAYPTMKQAALFIQDFLIENDQGQLVTSPSVSPENGYRLDDGSEAVLTVGATMDFEIIRHLYDGLIKSSEILDRDHDFRAALKDTLAKIPPLKIGKHGQLMEWVEDYEEIEPTHRHISHLYGVFPGSTVSVTETPEFADAARVTLERRALSQCSGFSCGTGWSRAHHTAILARLQEGDLAYQGLQQFFKNSVTTNLFSIHAPFQIDANFGMTAAIAEMLLQSHAGEIELLPALPSGAWQTGRTSGLRARGGYEVDIDWADGIITTATIHADVSGPVRIRYGDDILTLDLVSGQTRTVTLQDLQGR